MQQFVGEAVLQFARILISLDVFELRCEARSWHQCYEGDQREWLDDMHVTKSMLFHCLFVPPLMSDDQTAQRSIACLWYDKVDIVPKRKHVLIMN